MAENRTPPPSLVATPRIDRETEIFLAVRKVLEDNGEMGNLKALIQTKVLQILRGGEKSPIIEKKRKKVTSSGCDSQFHLLNQLILEYFHWFGYQYSVEMFASESGSETSCPPRHLLENKLGEYAKDIPILLEIIMNMSERK